MRFWLALSIALITGIHVAAQDAAPAKDLVIPLDTTGVSDWSYLNPARVPSAAGVSVIFHNTTPDRTFMVETDFVYDKAEFKTAYAGAQFQRRNRALKDVVCGALDGSCGDIASAGHDLDRIEELRILIEAITGVDENVTPPSKEDCAKTPRSAPCLVERLYWTSACTVCGDGLKDPWNTQLEGDARRLVRFLIGATEGRDVIDLAVAPCALLYASQSDKNLIRVRDDAEPDCRFEEQAGQGNDTLTNSIREIANDTAKRQFARERTHAARAALLETAKAELSGLFANPSIKDVRAALQKLYDDPKMTDARKADIEAAAKLLSSYSADSSIPFPLPDETSYAMMNTRQNTYTNVSRVGDYGVSIEKCAPTDGQVKCRAVATIPPHQRVAFSNATLKHNPSDTIQFSVSFFGRTAPPPNATAYVTLGETVALPSEFGINLGIDGTSAYDVGSGFTGHNRHTSGVGTTAIEFAGGIVEGSVSLRFKKGDFGGPSSTETVTVNEYQAKVFGSTNLAGKPHSLVFQYGQFGFAKPSSGIAINEEGEGLLLAFEKLAASYIIHRESDAADNKPNTQNDDYYVTMLQMKNLPFRWIQSVDGIDLTALYGNNKNDERPSEEPLKDRKSAYNFTTVGSEARFSFLKLRRLPNAAASVAVYHSERHVRPRRLESEEVVKGRGTVGLATFGWQWSGSKTLFEAAAKSRPSFGPTFTIARGTGDNPDTTDRDEGYLGETAGFANDQIFLSQIAADEELSKVIGQGLKNKWYAGVQWSDARGSLLGWLARHVGEAENIQSATTNISLHTYRFIHGVHDRHAAGAETNVEFLVEIPKDVTWSFSAAYYRRSEAVKLAGVGRDLWQISTGVTLKLKGP